MRANFSTPFEQNGILYDLDSKPGAYFQKEGLDDKGGMPTRRSLLSGGG